MLSLRSKVRWWAIYSRGFVIILQLLSNLALPEYTPSPSTDVPAPFTWVPVNPRQQKTNNNNKEDSTLDQLISLLLDGFVRHDAHHNLHIANNGYTYENLLSFFPLYPLVVQSVANSADWLIAKTTGAENDENGEELVISYVSLLKLMSAGVVNISLFVVSADVLYSLSRQVLKDEYLAYKSALLFCLNPASVFFSAPCADCAVAACVFTAMLAVEKRGLGLASAGLMAMASAASPFAMANVLFVVHRSMKLVATETILYVRAKKKKKGSSSSVHLQSNAWNIFFRGLLPGTANLLLALAPFAAFQWFAQATFCGTGKGRLLSTASFPTAIVRAGRKNGHVMPPQGTAAASNTSDWCANDPPLSYLYVMRKYSGAGFLTNWDGGKNYIPFIVAAPAAGLVLWQLYLFLSANFRYSIRLGLVDNTHLGLTRAKDRPCTVTLSLPRPCLVYVLHAAFLVVVCLTFLQLQVRRI